MAISRKNPGDVFTAADMNTIIFRRQLSGLLAPMTIAGGETKAVLFMTLATNHIANTKLVLTRHNHYLGDSNLYLTVDAGGAVYTMTQASPLGTPDFVLAGPPPANDLWGLTINLVNAGGSAFAVLPEGANYWLELAHVL